jgi:hypothetical protein
MNNEIRDKFKKFYYEKFGISLTDEEATEMASDLINLMKVLLKPTKPDTSVKHIHERREYAVVSPQKFT